MPKNKELFELDKRIEALQKDRDILFRIQSVTIGQLLDLNKELEEKEPSSFCIERNWFIKERIDKMIKALYKG